MKKIKLLMLLSAAMLLMGKANLCSSTYATDGNCKINESAATDGNHKINESAATDGNHKINESAEGNKSDENFKAPKSKIEEAEFNLKNLLSKGRFDIPNEFNKNIDKRKAVPKDVDISGKKKLINELIDNLIKCKFFKKGVIVKDIVVYSVELNHLFECDNQLLDLAQGIFSLYENFKKNRDFSPRELDGIKKSFKKCWGNLFEFEFNDKFLNCLNNMFTEDMTKHGYKRFLKIMLKTINTLEQFMHHFRDYEREELYEMDKSMGKRCEAFVGKGGYYDYDNIDSLLEGCSNNQAFDSKRQENNDKNRMEEFISNKYNSVKIPNNFDKDIHHTEIKSEKLENFEDFVRSAVNLDGSKQKKEENSTNLGVSNVGVDHFKFIYNKFTDLITRVNGIYVLSEAAVDFKTVIRGYISQNKSDENKKVIEKAIEDFNSYLKKFFGSQLGFEFESIVTNACTKLKLEDRAKDYEKFIEKSEKIVSGLEAIIKKFEENDKSSAKKQTKNDKKDANSLDANSLDVNSLDANSLDANILDANKITNDIFKDDDMLDDEKLENIKSYTDRRYEKFELPSEYKNIYLLHRNQLKLTKEEKKLLEDEIKVIRPYIEALDMAYFFQINSVSVYKALQINADHIKLIHNMLIDLIKGVEGMYSNPKYCNIKTKEELEDLLLKHCNWVLKLLKNFNNAMHKIFGCTLSLNFMESAYKSVVFFPKDAIKDYVLFELIVFRILDTLREFVNFLENGDEKREKVKDLLDKNIKNLMLSQNAQNNVLNNVLQNKPGGEQQNAQNNVLNNVLQNKSCGEQQNAQNNALNNALQNKPSGEQQNAQNNALNNVLQNKPSGEQQNAQNNVLNDMYGYIDNEELRNKLISFEEYILKRKNLSNYRDYLPGDKLLDCKLISLIKPILKNIEQVEKDGESKREINKFRDYMWTISRDTYVFREMIKWQQSIKEQLKQKQEQKNKKSGEQNAQNEKLSDELDFNDNLKNTLGEKNDKDKDKDALKNDKLNNNLNNEGKKASELSSEELLREENVRIEKEEKEKEKQKDVSSIELLKKKTNRPE